MTVSVFNQYIFWHPVNNAESFEFEQSSTDKSALRALKASKIIFEISCDFQGYFSRSQEGLKIIAWAAKRRIIIDFLFFAIFSRTLSSRNPLTWQSWAASQSQHVLQLIYLKIICSTDFIYSKFILHLSETWIHQQNYSQNKKTNSTANGPEKDKSNLRNDGNRLTL